MSSIRIHLTPFNYISDLNNITAIIKIWNIFKKSQIMNSVRVHLLKYVAYGGISLEYLLESIFNWITCNYKGNCLLFKSLPDSSETYCARLLWQCFPLRTGIISDRMNIFFRYLTK